MTPTSPTTPPSKSRALRAVGIVESHYEALKYLAWAKEEPISQLVGRAVRKLLEEEGVYLSARMLERCLICPQELNANTVARDLKKRNIWICAACRRQINREIDRRKAARPVLRPRLVPRG